MTGRPVYSHTTLGHVRVIAIIKRADDHEPLVTVETKAGIRTIVKRSEIGEMVAP